MIKFQNLLAILEWQNYDTRTSDELNTAFPL